MRKKRFPGENQAGLSQSNQDLTNYLQKCSKLNTVKKPSQLSYNDPWSDWVNYPLVAWPESLAENARRVRALNQAYDGWNPNSVAHTHVDHFDCFNGYPINSYQNQELMFSPQSTDTEREYNSKEMNFSASDFNTPVENGAHYVGARERDEKNEEHSNQFAQTETYPHSDSVFNPGVQENQSESKKENSILSNDINLSHGLFHQEQTKELNETDIEKTVSDDPVNERTEIPENKLERYKGIEETKLEQDLSNVTDVDEANSLEEEHEYPEAISQGACANNEAKRQVARVAEKEPVSTGVETNEATYSERARDKHKNSIIIWKNFPKK